MKIAALILDTPNSNRRAARKSQHFEGFSYTGFRRIIRDVEKKYPVFFCSLSDLNKYDYALLSLHSSKDVETFIYNFHTFKPNKNKCKIILGGSGVTNIKLFKDYIDIVCFGRGENQILDILNHKELSNVWYKDTDPNLSQIYHIRQAQEIIEDEAPTVGCLQKCAFCLYSYTHKPFNYNKLTSYQSAKDRLAPASVEDDFRHLKVKDGRNYTTALDGFSELTRKVINKPITDEDILTKIEDIYKQGIRKDMHVKIYMIAGFPWETWNTTIRDINHFVSLLKSADRSRQQMKLRFFLQVTPFMPEPLTPMQYMKPSLDVNWRNLSLYYRKSKIYEGNNLEAIIYPYIPAQLNILKRMYVNRATEADLANYKKLIFSKKINSVKADTAMYIAAQNNLMPNHIVNHVNYLPTDDYLRTYLPIKKLCKVMLKKALELNKTGQYLWQI